jgi:CheY-like chemotaxis protein
MPSSGAAQGVPVTRASLQRILLADDEPDILNISRMALETVGGYQVGACGSGTELLERLSDFDPDLVLVDLVMPDMAGIDVLREMQAVDDYRSTPVVFLTGVVDGGQLQQLRDAGAADVIRKPFDPMTLADRVREIWDELHDLP